MRLSIPLLAFALLTAEFLWPTEEAVSGLGLHLTVLWVLLGLLTNHSDGGQGARRTRGGHGLTESIWAWC